jgi:hypothetical protein
VGVTSPVVSTDRLKRAVCTVGLGGEPPTEPPSFGNCGGGAKESGTLPGWAAAGLLFAPLLEGLGLRELPIGLTNPLRRGAKPFTGVMTATWPAPSSVDVSESARIAAALSSTDGTLSSSCSVVLERGMRCGFVLCVPPKACRLDDGDEDGSGSMSRSKIADEEECTDVGEDGIDDGDLEPSLAGPVVRSVDCREGTFGVVMTPLFEVICRTSAGGRLA